MVQCVAEVGEKKRSLVINLKVVIAELKSGIREKVREGKKKKKWRG